jgi:hypothetical protein
MTRECNMPECEHKHTHDTCCLSDCVIDPCELLEQKEAEAEKTAKLLISAAEVRAEYSVKE